jgi:hypothetical protein
MEVLENGSVDCPLIRISGDGPGVCLRLKRVFERLAQGDSGEYSLAEVEDIEPVGGCRLVARAGERDRGVIRQAGNGYEWVLTPGTWDNVAGLIEPFCSPGAAGYQWLHQSGDVRVLLSPTGDW